MHLVVWPEDPQRVFLGKYDGYAPDIDSFTFNRRIKELGDSAKLHQKVEIEHKRGTIKEAQLLEKYKTTGSGIISSISQSEGIIEVEENVDYIKKGMKLKFLTFEDILS